MFHSFIESFVKICGKTSEKLDICICRGFRGGAPEAIEIIKIIFEKSMETCKF